MCAEGEDFTTCEIDGASTLMQCGEIERECVHHGPSFFDKGVVIVGSVKVIFPSIQTRWAWRWLDGRVVFTLL